MSVEIEGWNGFDLASVRDGPYPGVPLSFATRTAESNFLSVTQYASRLGSALRHVGGADLEGEVQRVQRRSNGMYWFSLTDGEAVLSCKVFARDAAQLEHQPNDGDLVRVRVDRPDFYAAQGSLSLIVSALSLAGEGELLRRRGELLARLQREGLCDLDRRRDLPKFPRAVGVVAGANSDAMSDVIRALVDRWPCVHIVTCASAVQGTTAPNQLIDSLARLQQHPLVDVIVVARGGGSVQDLVCFDDERLCRAMFACAVPVVCAIGHTDNTPVCNHVAWSAFTPSRSAELVVPSAAQLRHNILSLDREVNCGRAIELHAAAVGSWGQRISQAASRQLTTERMTLRAAAGTLDETADRMAALVRDVRQAGATVTDGIRRHRRQAGVREQLLRDGRSLSGLISRRIDDARRRVTHQADVVAARDFRRRGWLLASSRGQLVRSASDLANGDVVELRLYDGAATAVIEKIRQEPERNP
jgi:exodeoxyribonuclease VII large subunit